MGFKIDLLIITPLQEERDAIVRKFDGFDRLPTTSGSISIHALISDEPCSEYRTQLARHLGRHATTYFAA